MPAKLRKGDTVRVIAGKEKGREGTILKLDWGASRATVERLNLVWKHQRPSPRTGRGGRIDLEAPIHISNLVLLHKGEPTRVGFRQVEGKMVRWSKRHDEAIDA